MGAKTQWILSAEPNTMTAPSNFASFEPLHGPPQGPLQGPPQRQRLVQRLASTDVEASTQCFTEASTDDASVESLAMGLCGGPWRGSKEAKIRWSCRFFLALDAKILWVFGTQGLNHCNCHTLKTKKSTFTDIKFQFSGPWSH